MKKILVVEDDTPTAELVKALLFRNGHEVVHITDGAKAVAHARDIQPDLIILDVMLPGMDGLTIQTTLLKDEKTMKIPIILVTVDNQLEAVFVKSQNVAGFIAKPFDFKIFESKVKAVLGA